SLICQLCRSASEDGYHFFVSCHHKWPFWQAALDIFGLSQLFSDPRSLWTALTTLTDSTGGRLPTSSLVALGTIFDSLWRFHWCCIHDGSPWS
ncbi:MAG: hypothetical protein EXX96DRAFT_463034, partial [Benjaminiella poitrasii]